MVPTCGQRLTRAQWSAVQGALLWMWNHGPDAERQRAGVLWLSTSLYDEPPPPELAGVLEVYLAAIKTGAVASEAVRLDHPEHRQTVQAAIEALTEVT